MVNSKIDFESAVRLLTAESRGGGVANGQLAPERECLDGGSTLRIIELITELAHDAQLKPNHCHVEN